MHIKQISRSEKEKARRISISDHSKRIKKTDTAKVWELVCYCCNYICI